MYHQTRDVKAGIQVFRLLTECILLFLFAIAAAQAGDITLAWDKSPSTDVGGYKIYYGQTSGNYSANVDAGNVTSYTVSNLTAGGTYYFVATAYNTAHTEQSGYSNQVSAAVPPAPLAAPVASFSASATSGTSPLTITFSCTSTGDIASRNWDLGDGSTATGAIVSKYYANPGTYVVKLTAANNAGSSSATKTVALTAPATPPVADFTATPTSGTAPLTVNFTDLSTASSGNISAWSWNFGDGGTSTAENPSHSYSVAGTYAVSLTVTSSSGSNTKTTPVGYITVAASGGGGGGSLSGLVAAYGFEELNGATVVDASGNANHGTIQEATRLTSGKFGKALKFDGVNDWVTVNDSASLDFTSKMTLEAWVYPTSSMSAGKTVLVKEDGSSNSVYYLYANEDTNQPMTGARIGGYRTAYGVTQLPINKWSHLAGSYDGQYLRLYVNGVLVTMQTQTGTIPVSSGALRIGGNAIWGEYFKGYIDEVRVYNRALSQAEITADANKAVTAAIPANYKIGDQTIESVVDSNPQGMAEAFRASATSSATITEIQVYVDAASTATKLVAGIYGDASGHPRNRLGQGTITSPKAASWNSVAIPPVSIVKGQTYWLAILGPNGQLKFRVNGGTSGVMETSSSSRLTSLPSTWRTGQIYGDGPMSVFGAGY